MGLLLALAAGAALGGLGFRIRGGLLGDRWGWPGQASRAAYAVLMAAATLIAGGAPPGWAGAGFAAALAGAWFLGGVATGTMGAIDAGRNEGTPLGDGLRNAVRGVIYALPAAVVLAAGAARWGEDNWLWPALVLCGSGLLQGICYELAWRRRTQRPTEWAEVATGVCLGLGAAVAAAVADPGAWLI